MQTRVNVLYQAYSDWCRDGNLHPFSHIRFGSLLRMKGFVRVRSMAGMSYSGIGLLDSNDL